MEQCAAQIRDACLTQGFFQIVNHGIPKDLQKEMFKNAKEFFDLPTEEKMKLDKSKVLIITLSSMEDANDPIRTSTTVATKSCMAR